MKTMFAVIAAAVLAGCGDGDRSVNIHCYDVDGITIEAAQELAADAADNGIEVADYRSVLEAEKVSVVMCGGLLVSIHDLEWDQRHDQGNTTTTKTGQI